MPDSPASTPAAEAPRRPEWLRRLRNFAAMPLTEKLLLGIAWPVMGLWAAALRLVPFRRLAGALGTQVGAVGCVPLVDARQLARARMIRRALLRASQIAPFRADCLPQALAAATLSSWLGVPVAIHLGMRREGIAQEMAAHAWVCAGPVAVSGGHSFGSYAPVACFLPARLAAAA